MELLHKDITDKVLKSFYRVYNVLGYGFLEKVYVNAMCIELLRFGLHAVKQQHIKVHYDGYEVGEYFADLIVEGLVVIELKASECIVEEREHQII